MRIETQLVNLRYLDELATADTVVHRLNPLAKLATTLGFILIVTSFPRYEIASLIPFCLYPAILMNLGNLPMGPMAKRVGLALPFVLFIGILNPLLDPLPAMQLGMISISYGWLSFASIVIRSLLVISAALILIATTGMDGICTALLRLKVPKVLVVQLLFMYRYLYILLEEVARTIRAYSLRSFQQQGVGYRVVGSLIGQLLLRTLDRAQRIYLAMLCRGFDGAIRFVRPCRFRYSDAVYVLCWAAFFLFARTYNIPQWLGGLLMEGYK